VQTPYASRPWAAEPPSAGLPLTAHILAALRARGVAIARITEAAGLSATGDPAIDAALPFPERYEIPEATVLAIARARASGGRVIAGGTTVLRALEGAAAWGGGDLVAGSGVTDLRVGAGFTPLVVDGILTGIHEPGTSHYELMRAFLPDAALETSLAHAEDAGYLGHEFGDLCLVLGAPLARAA
jgi:S-adenosylmethionine:tRNA ribosyltransferase-isomerase